MPNKTEYRVVWKRRGMPRKSKRFQSLKAAERRVKLLGPEPWTAFNADPDSQYCCSGAECACYGETWRQHLLGERTEPKGPDDSGMPVIEYVHIEKRPLGEWQQVQHTERQDAT